VRGRKTTGWGRFSGDCLSDRCRKRRRKNIAQVKVYCDREGNTLTVWFGNPKDEYVCEETGDEVILMKDKKGRIIDFEKLNYSLPKQADLRIAFETVTA